MLFAISHRRNGYTPIRGMVPSGESTNSRFIRSSRAELA
jgi:hypothetical protein